MLERIDFESDLIPLWEALWRHWLRSCCVSNMWSQAPENHYTLLPLNECGCHVSGGQLSIDWDDPINVQKVRDTVTLLLKGCSCKKGCGSRRCGCFKNGKKCGPGCNSSNCANTSVTNTTSDAHCRQVDMDDIEIDELCNSEYLALQDKTCTMELIAESEDLEDETDKELECEVVCDDVDSDYVYTRFVTYFLCRLQTFSLKDERIGRAGMQQQLQVPQSGIWKYSVLDVNTAYFQMQRLLQTCIYAYHNCGYLHFVTYFLLKIRHKINFLTKIVGGGIANLLLESQGGKQLEVLSELSSRYPFTLRRSQLYLMPSRNDFSPISCHISRPVCTKYCRSHEFTRHLLSSTRQETNMTGMPRRFTKMKNRELSFDIYHRR